ncbi:Gfo/Idh/MocA family protein [Paenibacillus koleovorans]|uniref:Gfo/Idh/MocA family protein n=1 Tax=Paenibacillus koleovorans TaxID=121608 RepID=UPI000FDC8802|nr:Gfo/Idh/MocA family oxidoreductase [Paenibacillus koleovorans]
MSQIETLRIGIAGAGGRPRAFSQALAMHPRVTVAAICDASEDKLRAVSQLYGAQAQSFLSYEDMLEQTELDAVIIGTPMQAHAPQSLLALEQHLHVISEVPAATDLEQCRQLVEAVKHSRGRYLMAENVNYFKQMMLVKAMIRAGLFGELYYAEGEYLHESKELNELTKWRRSWQTGVNGITYGTHSIGPILDWFEGDRISQVSCIGGGHHYADASGRAYEQENTCVMLARTEQGRLIKIRQDLLSERPTTLNYQLQGTQGCYESDRFDFWNGKFYSKTFGEDKKEWKDMRTVEAEYLPKAWAELPEDQVVNHGGSDYVMMCDILAQLTGEKALTINIHQAMDMTLPGLVSQQSIGRSGEWVDVPDSRWW